MFTRTLVYVAPAGPETALAVLTNDAGAVVTRGVELARSRGGFVRIDPFVSRATKNAVEAAREVPPAP